MLSSMQILKVGESEQEESFMEKYPSHALSGLEVEARGIPARFGVESPRTLCY
jgi:hypothetical protein